MINIEEFVGISLAQLDPSRMKIAKAEAIEIAREEGRQWMDVYAERNMADPALHYEASVPRTLTFEVYDAILDKVDEDFRMLLVSL